MKNPKIFISCGELSGEAHAARVVLEIHKRYPQAELRAFGSDLLAELGVTLVENYRDYSFSGVSEVVSNLPKILSLKDRILEELILWEPDEILLVDYGGFNLELAKSIKERLNYLRKANPDIKIPRIVEYIAPQIWASRPWRINKIKANVDKVLCTLPFESKIYSEAGVNHKYVGNPVLSSLAKPSTKAQFLEEFNQLQYNKGLTNIKTNADEILIGLFPGSRKAEIKYMLPLMIQASNELIKRNPELKFRFILAKAPNISLSLLRRHGLSTELEQAQGATSHSIELLDPRTMLSANHKLLSAADMLWLCSGTVTLEAALYTTPYFLAYKSTFINYCFYLVFKTISMAGLANIISGKYIVKEFLQYKANLNNFVNETEAWLYDNKEERKFTGKFSNYYQQIKAELKNLQNQLSMHNSAKLVAQELLEL